MKLIKYEEIREIRGDRDIVIFGAGNYGGALCNRLNKDIHDATIKFCDNNKLKQGTTFLGRVIYPLNEVLLETGNKIFLICINSDAIHRNAKIIYEQLKLNGVQACDVFFVSSESLIDLDEEKTFKNTQEYIDRAFSKAKRKEILKSVREIKSIAYRSRLINNMGGGPAKVLETQEQIMGKTFEGITLSYYFREENEISISTELWLAIEIGAIKFVEDITRNDENVTYIAHDIFTACGLALQGKHYNLIYHHQGEYIYERRLLGRKFTTEQEALVKKIESYAVQEADGVYFPSEGAEFFFWKSWGISNIPGYKKKDALYNALVEENMTKKETIQGIEKDDAINILSIGYMTEAKGMDKIPFFLKELSIQLNKKIRWLAVGKGILKESILKLMEEIIAENPNIAFRQYDQLTHEQINYLFSISDMYLMLQRVSIFDISTLEAMYNNLTIVLSDIPGNREFNVENNVVLVNKHDIENVTYRIIEKLKTPNDNMGIYQRFFGTNAFKQRYSNMFRQLIDGVVFDE